MAIVCRLCGVELRPGDHVVTVNCGHLFHWVCMESSFKRATKCPVCLTRFVASTIQRVHLTAGEAAPPDDAAALRRELDRMGRKVRQAEVQVAKLRQLAAGYEAAQQKAQKLEKERNELRKKFQHNMTRNGYEIQHLKRSLAEDRERRKVAEAELATAEKQIRILQMQVGHEPKMANVGVQTSRSATANPRRPLIDVTSTQIGNVPATPDFAPAVVDRFAIMRKIPRLENGTTQPPPGRIYDGLGGTVKKPVEPSTPRRHRFR